MSEVNQDRQFQERADRIEELTVRLQKIAHPEARAAALELVQAVMDLHAEGLERLLSAIHDIPDGPDLLQQVADDPLVGGLLLLYGLHPEPLPERIARSLDKVRPYLQSHGGDVEVVEIAEAKVRVRLTGSFRNCPSTAATLRQAVERAIYEGAPDVTEVVAEQAQQSAAASQLVQLR